MRVPEEINRRIVDHTADINLDLQHDCARLPARLPPDMVIKTGSPMFEVLNHYREGIEHLMFWRGWRLEAGKFVVSAHREEMSIRQEFSQTGGCSEPCCRALRLSRHSHPPADAEASRCHGR